MAQTPETVRPAEESETAETRTTPRGGPQGNRWNRWLSPPYLLIAPALVLLTGVLFWPIVQMVWNSFYEYSTRHLLPNSPPAEWVGVQHYTDLLSDPQFWTILRNTVLVCGAMVVLTMVLGTLVGLLLNRLPNWFSTVVGIGMMLAWATPVISASMIYKWLFEDRSGLVNHMLAALPDWLVGSGWLEYQWFLDPLPLFSVLVLIIVWQAFPFIALSVLAGLKSIPGELYEAARVDGAGAWRSFWAVTFPMLRPLFALLLILQIIWDLRVFTQLYILAGGFQNESVYLLSYYIYQQGFSASPPNYGMGSAIAVVMTVMILGITAYYLRIMIRQGETR
ncbi:carbohydrate ABC transporter membrane protein 1 (CUT1 family) [Haloactinospora alba]|uniref:Carbohydrate ABC transporter membrane protein 1 (CUT1 family) n=1 Tax=Haloactinospora alba TaxID=405555 RepID=A0A543NGP5_9ACTN|nr:sugar ABC transporter permease [Haloactinospora alba]TQN31025.1 carbohydrate ABC transporter membrane protein 1 (CUT1 family) [Haloactinospora alba]